MIDHLFGIDISHWQGEVDFEQVAAAGVKFCIFKVTQGDWLIDVRAGDNYDGCVEHGIVPGAYHFWEEKVTTGSGKKQADHFLDAIETVTGGSFQLILVLDFEADGAVSNAIAREEVQGFMLQVWRRTGRHPIVYTRETVFEDLLRLPEVNGSVPGWVSLLEVWPAYYGINTPDGDLDAREAVMFERWVPEGFISVRMWQYTDKGVLPGIAGKVDLNRFYGTEADLKLRAGLIPPLGARFAAVEQEIWGPLKLWHWVNRLRQEHGL